MKFVVITLLLLSMLVPASLYAKTHKDNYNVSCAALWPAVKDVLRNSGKYGILGIDSNEMTASFVIGGTLGGKRINSVVLNKQGENGCEMQTQTAFSGLVHNDAGDFKSRVDESLNKLQAAAPPAATPSVQPDADKKLDTEKKDIEKKAGDENTPNPQKN